MRLRRRNRSVPELNMAAMPDLIFTVLFFFMIVTHMRQNTVQVTYQEPQGSGLVKVTNKAALIHVYVGHRVGESDYLVQVEDRVVAFDDIAAAVTEERSRIAPDQLEFCTVSMQADKDVPMSVINKVKMALREAKALKINYAGVDSPASRQLPSDQSK